MVNLINKQNVKYSLRNLMQRKSRSLLTILSIFIGITTIFVFISFGLGLYEYIAEFTTESSADKLLIQGKGGSVPGTSNVILNEDDLDVILKTRGILEAEGIYFDVFEVESGGQRAYAYGTGMDMTKAMFMEYSSVKIEAGRQIKNGEGGKVVLGYAYQFDDKIFAKGLKVNDRITLNGEKYKIIGFYNEIGNPADDSNVYFDIDSWRERFDSDSFAMIMARGDINDLSNTEARVEKELRKSRGLVEGKEDFTVVSFVDELENYLGAMNIVIAFIVMIALISVIVSAVNTANTMITSVLERTKEIGIIKAIGAKNSEIFNIFLFESSFLGFVAGVIGVTLGFIICYALGQLLNNIGYGFLSPSFNPLLFIGLVSFAVIVGAISGVVPAANAARKKPVDSLRDE